MNYISSEEPIWFGGPDIIASVLLNDGKVPHILKAIRILPVGKQAGLTPGHLLGKVRIDPSVDDFYKYVVEQKRRTRQTPPSKKVWRTIYGFLAPTGRFSAGANTNVGSGYWTSVVASGQTIYLTTNKATALSAFQMYEFHGTQEGTNIHPGQTFNLDYSLTQTFSLRSLSLQPGLVGYGQWQTTNKSGPNVTPEQAAARYKVYALGAALNATLPERKVSVGAKYFHEFDSKSTFQGYTVQISAMITF